MALSIKDNSCSLDFSKKTNSKKIKIKKLEKITINLIEIKIIKKTTEEMKNTEKEESKNIRALSKANKKALTKENNIYIIYYIVIMEI